MNPTYRLPLWSTGSVMQFGQTGHFSLADGPRNCTCVWRKVLGIHTVSRNYNARGPGVKPLWKRYVLTQDPQALRKFWKYNPMFV